MKKLAFITALLITAAFRPSGYVVGDKAIDFKLKNVDGKMVSMADYKDAKGFIVVFTCNHCPFAKAYEDRIIALNTKYKSQGYPVIAINPNDTNIVAEDSYTNMQLRAKTKSYSFPYLIDITQSVAKTYGAKSTPHVFVLQKSGSDLMVKYIGAIDDNSDDATAVKEKYVENAVDELIAGKAVTKTSTKAIGC
ncbi:MAG TPA: thioredoxin family protein, partial [Bacteroidia bacterium]|nr:thioredoxin family protein [Bacteroidia bacterium]